MFRMRQWLLFAAVAVVALAAGIGVHFWHVGGDGAVAQNASANGDPAKAIYALKLPDLAGKPQAVEQWRGKVLVVNFWATWCAPCREEIPIFVQLQEKYRAKGLQFVGISIDQADKTAEFARNFGVNYPVVIGGFDTVEVSRVAGNDKRALPFTVILDRQGRVFATELGGIKRESLEPRIAKMLEM